MRRRPPVGERVPRRLSGAESLQLSAGRFRTTLVGVWNTPLSRQAAADGVGAVLDSLSSARGEALRAAPKLAATFACAGLAPQCRSYPACW